MTTDARSCPSHDSATARAVRGALGADVGLAALAAAGPDAAPGRVLLGLAHAVRVPGQADLARTRLSGSASPGR